MTSPTPAMPYKLNASRRYLCLFATVFILTFTASPPSLRAQEDPAKKPFDIPAGSAETTLKTFSDQAGVDVIFGTKTAANVLTASVRGQYTAGEAIALLLSGTDLVATRDPKTGAFTISVSPNVQG